MKRILKLLARLYPAEWRRRYGAEYEALLEEGKPRLRDAFDVLWNAMMMQAASWEFVRVVVPCALVGGLAAVAISFVAPPRYASQATFMVAAYPFDDGVCGSSNGLPVGLRGNKPVVCSDPTTFKDYLKFASAGGFSREFLASVIKKEGLYPRKSLDLAIDEMRKSIRVTTPKAGSQRQFEVQFDYPDPRVAERVDDVLASEVVVRVKNEQWEKFLQVESLESQERLKLLRARLRLANSPSEAKDLRSGIRQALAFQSAGLHVQPLTVEGLGLRTASFPQRPEGLSRSEDGVIGLVAGVVGGLIAAVVVGWRRRVTVANA